MKRFLSALVLSVAALSAQASILTFGTSCSVTNITSAIDCQGSLWGNDVGYNTAATGVKFGNLAFANGATDNTPFSLIDTTDSASGSQIALIFGTGGRSGDLLIKDTDGELVGKLFGISLKAGNHHSLYLFDAATTDLGNVAQGWTSLSFSTIGTSVNWKGKAQDLSHASLWGFALSPNSGVNCEQFNSCDPVSQVPEPGTGALMLAGLGAAIFVGRRRKKA